MQVRADISVMTSRLYVRDTVYYIDRTVVVKVDDFEFLHFNRLHHFLLNL